MGVKQLYSKPMDASGEMIIGQGAKGFTAWQAMISCWPCNSQYIKQLCLMLHQFVHCHIQISSTSAHLLFGTPAPLPHAGQSFEAPSAFSVFVKRLQTPGKQGDDGWRSVQVEGVPLEEWRHRYSARAQEKIAAASGAGGSTGGADNEGSAGGGDDPVQMMRGGAGGQAGMMGRPSANAAAAMAAAAAGQQGMMDPKVSV